MMPYVEIKTYFYFLVGASLGLGGLNLANLTFDPNTLKLDKRLLSKIKTLMPGKILYKIKQKTLQLGFAFQSKMSYNNLSHYYRPKKCPINFFLTLALGVLVWTRHTDNYIWGDL